MVAIRDGKMIRVEVKAASETVRNRRPAVTGVKPDKFDMLLVVLPSGKVLENPTCNLVYGCLSPQIDAERL